MPPISKLTIGILTHKKMLRLNSLWGQVIDELSASTPDNLELKLPLTATAVDPVAYSVIFPNEHITVTAAISDVIVTKSSYEDQSPVHVDKFLTRYAELWGMVNRVLRVRDIRRIGIYAERRITGVDSPSEWLIKKLTSIPAEDEFAKIAMHFERKRSIFHSLPI